MFFLSFVEVQQGSGGRAFAGRVTVASPQARIGEEQGGELFQERIGAKVACQQQVQGEIFDCIERYSRFQAGQVQQNTMVDPVLCVTPASVHFNGNYPPGGIQPLQWGEGAG